MILLRWAVVSLSTTVGGFTLVLVRWELVAANEKIPVHDVLFLCGRKLWTDVNL
jgi:hypothetical protein